MNTRRINEALNKAGAVITAIVGTMWCAIIFTVIGIMGVTGALSGNIQLVLIVGAISGYFLQLVLLPIIIVGQNAQGAKTEQRDNETHDRLIAYLDSLHAETHAKLDDHTNLLTK